MSTSDASTALSPAQSADILRLVDGHHVEELREVLTRSVSHVAENSTTRAVLRLIAAHIADHGARHSADSLVALEDAVLGVTGLRDGMFGRERCALLLALAAASAAAGAPAQAQGYDLRVLQGPPSMTSHMLPLERLESTARLLRCAALTGTLATVDAVALRALSEYHRVCRQLTESGASEAAGPTLVAFLADLGLGLARRGHFADASRAFAELHERGGDPAAFVRAVASALLTGAGQARDRMLGAYELAPARVHLGELAEVLARAAHTLLLRAQDMDVLARCGLAVEADVPPEAVREAVNQHNLVAISKLYDNISIEALARRMFGMDAEAVEEAVVSMVAEGRLHARVDQASGWILFDSPDSTAAMTEWDSRIGTVCKAMSRATELATLALPELRQYL